MNEYRDVFQDEARENLKSMSDQLLALEQDPGSSTAINELFRFAHNLKGMSGSMGYRPMVSLTHSMENVLDRMRAGHLEACENTVNVLFGCVDMLEEMLSSLDSMDDFAEACEELSARLGALEGGAPPEKVSAEAIETPNSSQPDRLELNESERHAFLNLLREEKDIWRLRVSLDPDCVMKSVRAYMVFKAAQKHGQIVKSVPPAADLEDVTASQEVEEEIGQDIILLVAGEEPDALVPQLESISEVRQAQYRQVAESEVAAKDSPTRGPESSGPAQPAAKAKERSVRVETEKLDSLINLVGELVISRTRVMDLTRQNGRDELSHSLQQLNRIITDVQDATMKLRMVGIKHVFDRFPRMVRDLSKSSGKAVRLEIHGEETELDRTIVNEISDPLVHLLRNAIDHGIESGEERREAGKAEEGTIQLQARHEGSHVVISVQDDGRGIDPDLVRQKAVERGILSEREAKNRSNREMLDFIFEPSFSTAGEVTDVSGRGVGMDAVKTAITDLNGTVETESQVGRGTSVSLRLPLTLAIIRALLVRAGQIYAIPVEAIRENLHLNQRDIRTVNQREVIVRREEVIPLLSLTEELHGAREEPGQIYPAVVVGTEDNKVVLIVHELLGQQEIVVKSLSSAARTTPAIAGATVLGDGRVVLIVDSTYLLTHRAREDKKAVPASAQA